MGSVQSRMPPEPDGTAGPPPSGADVAAPKGSWLARSWVSVAFVLLAFTGWLYRDQGLIFFAAGPAYVDILLGLGANPRATGDRGATALHAAAFSGSVGSVRRLLSAGADANARDTDGRTPLYRAAEAGRLDAIRDLLAAGADPSIRDSRGRDPADAARENGLDYVLPVLAGAPRSAGGASPRGPAGPVGRSSSES